MKSVGKSWRLMVLKVFQQLQKIFLKFSALWESKRPGILLVQRIFCRPCSPKGNSSKIRHVALLADLMSSRGEIVGIRIPGLAKMESVLGLDSPTQHNFSSEHPKFFRRSEQHFGCFGDALRIGKETSNT